LVHACCLLFCRLEPILQDLLSMLTGYIRLVLECITSVSSYQQTGVFPHCLPPMQHWKSSSNDWKSFTLN
jgi:hypothetical protein